MAGSGGFTMRSLRVVMMGVYRINEAEAFNLHAILLAEKIMAD